MHRDWYPYVLAALVLWAVVGNGPDQKLPAQFGAVSQVVKPETVPFRPRK